MHKPVSLEQLTDADCKIITKDGKTSTVPFVKIPSIFPDKHYLNAVELQPVFNQLVALLVSDASYLDAILQQISDPFVQRLLKMSHDSPDPTNVLFFILRSDYMIDAHMDRLLQIELNTISCANGALSDRLASEHEKNGFHVVKNDFILKTANAFKQAHQLWIDVNNKGVSDDVIIVFVVNRGETNVFDQRLLAAKILEQNVKVEFATMLDEFKLGSGGHLELGARVVSIVYFRTLYSPEQFESGLVWDRRSLIEKSTAIKLPNIPTFLAGLKKVQQVLCDGQFVAKHGLRGIQHTFAEQYSLENFEECMRALQASPEGFVLKPQREGGGNNTYGADVMRHIANTPTEERSAYVLMRLIDAPRKANVGANRGGRDLVIEEAVSELGIFGLYLRAGDNVHINADAGWLLRTKSADEDEGGVCAGISFFDALLSSS